MSWARQIPNVISGFRIFLVPPIAWLLLQGQYKQATALVFIAGCSDGLDGWLARRFDWRSRVGAALDPLADKLLVATSFGCLWWQGFIPTWLLLAVLARDLYLVVGGLIYNYFFQRIEMLSPSFISKANTALQLLLVIVTLLHAAWPELLSYAVVLSLSAVVLLTTLASFVDYAWVWSRRARSVGLKKRGKQHEQ